MGRLVTPDQLDFSTLYDQYAATLLGVISRLVPDSSEATQVLETTFAAILLEMDQFQPDKQPLFVWLLHIARRTAVDALKERRLQAQAGFQLTTGGKVISSNWNENGPARPVHPRGSGTDPQQKELLDSVLFKNCTPEEAALTLGISVDQARQQLRLAMQQLCRTTSA